MLSKDEVVYQIDFSDVLAERIEEARKTLGDGPLTVDLSMSTEDMVMTILISKGPIIQ